MISRLLGPDRGSPHAASMDTVVNKTIALTANDFLKICALLPCNMRLDFVAEP
jgi:hypothetical protein